MSNVLSVQGTPTNPMRGIFPADEDDCFREPCQNGGDCLDGINSFTCDCASGFSGDFCQNSKWSNFQLSS